MTVYNHLGGVEAWENQEHWVRKHTGGLGYSEEQVQVGDGNFDKAKWKILKQLFPWILTAQKHFGSLCMKCSRHIVNTIIF